MPDDSKWAGFVRAHRLAKHMNQSAFADSLGVSQQTVSRWESGSQIPDTSIQARLKQQLRTTALGSTAFWKHRVTHSVGHEVLIDRNLMVMAASAKAAALMSSDGSITGASFADVLPDQSFTGDTPSAVNSLKQFREMGFFDGLIRSIRLETEWHVALGSCLCKTDVWPILTSEQTIIGQFTGTPVPISPDLQGLKGVRVLRVDVRLNKDAQNE